MEASGLRGGGKQPSRGTAATIKHGGELGLAYKRVKDIRSGEEEKSLLKVNTKYPVIFVLNLIV